MANPLVNYKLPIGPSQGKARPALVLDTNEDGTADLLVFSAGVNDGMDHVTYVHGVTRGDGEHEYQTVEDASAAHLPDPVSALPAPASTEQTHVASAASEPTGPTPADVQQAHEQTLVAHMADGTPVYAPYSTEQLLQFAEQGLFPNEHGELVKAPGD